MDNTLRLEFPARSANVAVGRVCVAVFAAQLDPTVVELDDIKLAVSEAVTNAIVHAYPNGEGLVRIAAAIEDGVLTVTVADDGVGIADVERAREPAYSSDPERMGLGFAFMDSAMDEVRVQSAPGGGTRVTLVKRLRAAAE
jgi:stage II sporulation protein AB (anti-sigma F factor)